MFDSFTSGEYSFINYTECSPSLLEEILAMRNDEDVRKWMTNTDIITEEEHRQFVESLKTTADRVYYAVLHQGELVASINLTRLTCENWDRGIIAAASIRGTGQIDIIEKKFMGHLKGSDVKLMTAKIKNNNIRSIRHFIKAGFEEVGKDDEYTYFKIRVDE